MQSYSTPGWNDPPTNTTTANVLEGNNRLITHKYRRPVHPSIQSSAKHENDINSIMHSAMLEQQQPMHSSGSVDIHINNSLSQQNLKPMNNCETFDAFTVSNASTVGVYDFAKVRSTASDSALSSTTNLPMLQNFASASPHPLRLPSSDFLHTVNAMQTYKFNAPIEANPNAMIYTLPNMIDESDRRPATLPQLDSQHLPKKAAGDVSLTGAQLSQFMAKAINELQPGVIRDGIILRINQFSDLIEQKAMSDGFLKKLNFVVDAMDRGLYADAMEFVEQMNQLFPSEMKSSWVHGLRLLLNELRRPERLNSVGGFR